MKKSILFLIVAFVFTNISLFAFENDLFKVNENGWKIENSSKPNTFLFSLKDFVKEDPKNVEPKILIEVNEFGENRYIKDDSILLDAAKLGANETINLRKKIISDTFTREMKARIPSITNKQIEEILEKELGTVEIENPSYTIVDGHKAAVIESTLGYIKTRLFVFMTLRKAFTITITYTEPTSIDSISEYDQFISSFNSKDKKATYYNAVISPLLKYGFIFSMLLLIGVVIVVIVAKKAS